MPPKLKRTPSKPAAKMSPVPLEERVDAVVAWLKRHGTKATRDGMARYAISSDKAFGVTVGALKKESKRLGRDHDLAEALWRTGWYEARMLATMIDDPERVTAAQMDRWCRDFDNWGVCDTACFVLFDRTADAWRMVDRWSARREEFQKRATFALLWSLTVHDKRATDAQFLHGLKLVEREAGDERNFVKKAVNMALRAVGKRNRALHAAAVRVARKLADSPQPAARWNGKDALRELASPSVARRLATRRHTEKG